MLGARSLAIVSRYHTRAIDSLQPARAHEVTHRNWRILHTTGAWYLWLGRLNVARNLVVSSPELLGGTPVIRGTRIPVYDVAASAAAGIPTKRILAAYPSLDAGSGDEERRGCVICHHRNCRVLDSALD
jgi:uncharacterized protein (DUF433 family)